MAWKLRKKRGFWQIRFTHEGVRHEISTGHTDRKKAQIEGARLYENFIAKRPSRVRGIGDRVPLETVTDEWIENIRGDLGAKVPELYEGYAAKWVGFFETLNGITTDTGTSFVQRRLREVLRTTIQKELGALRRFLAWCEANGYILEAPLIKPVPKGAKGKKHPQRRRSKAVEYSAKEAEKFLKLLPERAEAGYPVQARFRFQYETGLRSSLLDRIRPKDLKISGRGAVLKVREEIDKSEFAREVPLSPKALEAIRSAIDPKAEFIFGEHDYRHWTRPAALIAFGEERGETFTPQHFRSIRITGWLDEGLHLPAVAYLVGHTQLTTTAGYARLGFDQAARALGTIGDRTPGRRAKGPPRSRR